MSSLKRKYDEIIETREPCITFSTERKIEPIPFPLFPLFRDIIKKIASFLDHDSYFCLLSTNKEVKKALDDFFVGKNSHPKRYVISKIIKFKNEATLETNTIVSPNDLVEVTMMEIYKNFEESTEKLLPFKQVKNVRIYGDARFRIGMYYYLEKCALQCISLCFPNLETLELVHLAYFIEINQYPFPNLQYLRIFSQTRNTYTFCGLGLHRDMREIGIYTKHRGHAEIQNYSDNNEKRNIEYLHGDTEILDVNSYKTIVNLDKHVVKASFI